MRDARTEAGEVSFTCKGKVCKAMQYLESGLFARNGAECSGFTHWVCCHMKGQKCCLRTCFSEELVLSLQHCG